jgi:hypothetical protein
MYRIFCHLQEQLFVEDVDDDESGSPADEDNQRFDEHEDGASPAGQHEEYFGYQNDPGSDDQEDEVKPAFVRTRVTQVAANSSHASDEGSQPSSRL